MDGTDGRGSLRSEECKVLGVYGRDTVNTNCDLLLSSFSANHGPALLNMFFSPAKKVTSYSQGPGIVRVFARQVHRHYTGHPHYMELSANNAEGALFRF